MKVLHSSNERGVFIAGNEFGETCYILAESFEDAYDVLLCDEADRGNICDHGGDLTDEQVIVDGGCDCNTTSDGRFVWAVYLWLRPLAISVDQFTYALTDDGDTLA